MAAILRRAPRARFGRSDAIGTDRPYNDAPSPRTGKAIFHRQNRSMSDPRGAAAASPRPQDLPRPYALRLLPAAPVVLATNVLACVVHGETAAFDTDPRRIHVALPLLEGAAVELWESATPVRHGWQGDIGFAENGQVLFGQLRVPEAALDDAAAAAFEAYTRIAAFLDAAGYPATLRIWNFIPGITDGVGDDERYRQFVLGRYRALAQRAGFERELPAATAIGSRGGELLIYFLAAAVPGQQVENPRQLSAFRYPREYGPRSPSFSRANLLCWRDGSELFVSGTASIVGHETRHVGAPQTQLEETLANIAALLEEADVSARWEAQSVKLYVRDAALFAQVQTRFDAAFVPAPTRLVLCGEVCRSGLDLEIEASFRRVN
jgi:chorismate lyase/3-hydroxybenzoate synthase